MNHPACPTAVPAQIAHAHELVRRLGEPLLGGNHASVLADAPAARNALLAVLARAGDHVNLDAALLHAPGMRDDLLTALAALCQRGVRVQVLLAPTQHAPDAALRSLCEQGATVRRQAPCAGLAGWVERRVRPAQRQLAVIDGRVAWLGPGLLAQAPGAQAPHVCVRGPIVQRLQRLFLTTGVVAEPGLPPAPARHFPAIPLSGRQRMGLARGARPGSPLLGALETARFSIFIALGRRVPSRRVVQAIAAAATRGVSVSVLLQNGGPPYARPWRAACAALMQSGAWLYQGDEACMLPSHCIVDGVWSGVAIDGGSGWHSGTVIESPQLVVLDPVFASELDDVCQAAMSRALLLDVRSLAAPAPWQRWLRPPTAGTGASPPVADHAITSVHGRVEGPGLSP